MSDSIDLGEDIGFVSVSINGAECRVDVWECYSELTEMYVQHATAPTGFRAAVANYLGQLGFPDVSHHMAEKFAANIFARVEAMKKKDSEGTMPDSPSTTESIPSA